MTARTPGGMLELRAGALDPALRGQQLNRLRDEQGIPLCLGVDRIGHSRPGPRAGRKLDVLGHVGGAQPGERQLARVGLPHQLGHRRGERVAGRRVDIAIRGHDEQAAVVQPAGDKLQQEERRLVGGMQVVEHDDERAVLRSASEEPAHGLEHLKARARLRQGRRVAELGEELAYLGQELRQERGSGSELGPQGVRVRIAQMHLEGLDPGPVRRGAARLPRAPDQDLRTARARLLHQSVGKAALSDSRLAGHEHHASVAGERFIQAGHQLGELPVAADERAPRGGGRGLMLIRRGGGSSCSETSWARIARSSSRSRSPGSMPSSSTSAVRASW